jgi:hypothetical protein
LAERGEPRIINFRKAAISERLCNMNFPEVSSTLDFTGISFKEKVVEFFLMVSGKIFYRVILRPVEYFRPRKKENGNSNDPPAGKDRQS